MFSVWLFNEQTFYMLKKKICCDEKDFLLPSTFTKIGMGHIDLHEEIIKRNNEGEFLHHRWRAGVGRKAF